MEHPGDPANTGSDAAHQQCASWWATPQRAEASRAYGLELFTGAQCRWGHVVEKVTSLWTNMAVQEFHAKFCNHPEGHMYRGSTASLSRWAWGLNLLICKAIASFVARAPIPENDHEACLC